MKAFPIIVSSPSGAGKTTIVDAVLKKNKTVSRVITATTRAPRKGEKDGKDYHFWTIKHFESFSISLGHVNVSLGNDDAFA